jgi:hypothetical protein
MRHPVIIDASNYASNSIIRNNIFIDCGEPGYLYPSNKVGWYQITEPGGDSVIRGGNFVAGEPPGYAPKTGFDEGSSDLNGGNPGFVNSNDPLGPDGVPFTADDGLRLLPTSKLVGAGAGGRTPGAYEVSEGEQPRLELQMFRENKIRLLWPETVEAWTLQTARSVIGLWNDFSVTPLLSNGFYQVTTETTNEAGYYRLAR